MKVILKKDLKGTGKAGDVVNVSDGYARNMLLPRGIAIEATTGNVRVAEAKKAAIEEQKAEEKAAAEALAEELKDKKVTIKAKSGEDGRLFGSITSKDIAEAAKKQLDLKVDKKKIVLNSPIKQIGRFDVDIKLYPEIKGVLTVEIVD